mgnify:CR=1 FL=1
MAEVTETNIQTDVPAENQSVERCLTFESGDMTLFLSINNVTSMTVRSLIFHWYLIILKESSICVVRSFR